MRVTSLTPTGRTTTSRGHQIEKILEGRDTNYTNWHEFLNKSKQATEKAKQVLAIFGSTLRGGPRRASRRKGVNKCTIVPRPVNIGFCWGHECTAKCTFLDRVYRRRALAICKSDQIGPKFENATVRFELRFCRRATLTRG